MEDPAVAGFRRALFALALLIGLALQSQPLAHVGSPDIFLETSAGPYRLLVTVRPPYAIPGIADVEVRATSDDVRDVRIVPLPLTGDGARFAPVPDRAERSREDPRLFTGHLWLMSAGAWQVRIAVNGDRGEGTIAVPVPTLPQSTLAMSPALRVILSIFMFLLGGVMLYTAFALNIGPDTRWFAYVPLSGPEYAPGKRVDVWAQLVNFTELASLAVATQIIATVMTHRAPGMSIERIPLFVWALFVQSLMVIFAMPAVMTASLFLATDRLVGTHFFNQAEGGDALLWQHLFWFFGHPEVYIIFIPALGMVSQIIATFTGRPTFGYLALVVSLFATAFLGFSVWVHHMFTTGLPALGLSFFTAASLLIAIPSGVQIFCWIAALWKGRPRFELPLSGWYW